MSNETDDHDIVTRLRRVAEFGGTHLVGLWTKAADEIKRLRGRLAVHQSRTVPCETVRVMVPVSVAHNGWWTAHPFQHTDDPSAPMYGSCHWIVADVPVSQSVKVVGVVEDR